MTTLAVSLLQGISIGGQMVSLASTVGTDVIICTLTNTTAAIGSMLIHLTAYDKPGMEDIKHRLLDTDLEHTVGVIEELVKEQDTTKEMPNSVKKALIGVNETLNLIHRELLVIKNAMDHHETKWFGTWRAFDCRCNIDVITKNKNILDRRYNMFVQLLEIYK